jgi:hypothetical protein
MEKLKNIPDRNPFRVPENYFEEVNKKILASSAGTESESKKSGFYIRLRPFLAVAASVAILIAVSYTAVRLFNHGSSKKDIINGISFQEFSDSYLNDIDILTLEQNSDPLVMSGKVPDLSKPEIIDYLLLENINENEIYELL